MHAPGSGTDINLLMVGIGDSEVMSEVPILSQSCGWRSVTPFVPVRHYKRRGQKKDTCDWEYFPEIVLREELERRGLPDPKRVQKLDRCELWDHWEKKRSESAQSLSWLQFREDGCLETGGEAYIPAVDLKLNLRFR